jgi:hypothetical protein
MQAAELHERAAVTHDRAAFDEAYRPKQDVSRRCGDEWVLNDNLRSGDERLTSWWPCWDAGNIVAQSHDMHASSSERQAARAERRAAADLIRAEVAACAGISDHDRVHSVFDTPDAVARVIPYREGGQVRSVRIVLQPMSGLTQPWVQRSINCQRAQFATKGNPADFSPDDPTLVAGAVTKVVQNGDHVEVIVTTPDAKRGEIALGRAQALENPISAAR